MNVLSDESVDHVLSILLLSVAIEWHRDLSRRCLELRGEVSLGYCNNHK